MLYYTRVRGYHDYSRQRGRKLFDWKPLSADVMDQAARLASNAAKPIDDIRGSAAYRKEIVRVVTLRGLMAIAEGREDENIPETQCCCGEIRHVLRVN